MRSDSDVLVIGAGPVGLMMAAELRRHGATCRLVERLTERSSHCKALGITPRTMEVWDDLGIAQQALNSGMPLKGLVSIANGDWQHGEESGVALADGAYGFLTLAQYDVERILAEHLLTLGGQIERGVELVDVAPAKDQVTATLKLANGSQERVKCQYLIGCDGGRSLVRHVLKLPFEGDHYEQVFMLADVELDWQLPRGYAYKMARMEDDKILAGGACIPVPGNARPYRVSTGAPPEIVPKELASAAQAKSGISDLGPTLEQVQGVLDFLFPAGAKASNMKWSAFYRISHRIVSAYRVDPVFLAGDAAHLHPPLGGQGLNTGVQDAYNLAWKLALAVRGEAATSLLDSYDAERRPIGEQIVKRTAARMNQLMAGQVEESEPVRDDSQLFLNYRESPIVARDAGNSAIGASHAQVGPMSGDRAPDVLGLRRHQVQYDLRLFDLTRGTHHTLFLYTNFSNPRVDCQEFAALARELNTRYGGKLQAYAIVHPSCGLQEYQGVPLVVDGRNEFARLYGAGRGSGYLIRPDGYLSCRAATDDGRDPSQLFGESA